MERDNLLNNSFGKHQGKEVKIDIGEELNLPNIGIEKTDIKEKLKPASICRVPRNLRKINHEAYTPQLISIGPLHRAKGRLTEMEEHKKIYKEDFFKRFHITKEGWEVLKNFIEENEKFIRECYADNIKSSRDTFIEMILSDAIFIIELFLKFSERAKDEFLLDNTTLMVGIRLDLQLIENQLPYIVLEELYNHASGYPTGETPSFYLLSCTFLSVEPDMADFKEVGFLHFVDLRRNSLVKNLPHSEKGGQINDLPSVVKLHESGVNFKNIGSKCLLDIKFQKACTWKPFFKVHELQIPQITIDDHSECLFRNMMALEQFRYSSKTHICNYIWLMDYLINTEKDVDLLVEKKIIINMVGEHATIAKMFNRLCLQIAPSRNSCYKDISEKLKIYHENWWNRTTATLKSVYFTNLWRGTGTIAAAILLVLTLLQTIWAIK